MLDDLDIIEDWTIIKKAVKQKQQQQKRTKTMSSAAERALGMYPCKSLRLAMRVCNPFVYFGCVWIEK